MDDLGIEIHSIETFVGWLPVAGGWERRPSDIAGFSVVERRALLRV
jgi:hypothetical protein